MSLSFTPSYSPRLLFICLLVLGFAMGPLRLQAEPGGTGGTYLISSAKDLADQSQNAQPGDTFVLKNGTYTDQHFILKANGSTEKPITLRAETAGKVVITGGSQFSISGSYLIIEGLEFKGGALKNGSIFSFRSPDDSAAHHSILRHCTFIDYNPSKIDTRYFWVSVYGHRNLVEHCLFSGQKHSGVTLCVWLDSKDSGHHIICNNHFKDRAPGNANGFETIRIGTSKTSMQDAHCLVEENLFERCDGEIEIISNKSGRNIYRRNTFHRSRGTLTLRHGNHCQVIENIFLGEKVKGTGGLRVMGEGHLVSGNYFSGTTARSQAAIAIHAGIPDSPLNGYLQVKGCRIEKNTFADNQGPLISLGTGFQSKQRTLLPEGVILTENLLIASDQSKPVILMTPPYIKAQWKKNWLINGESGIAENPGLIHRSKLPQSLQSRLKVTPLKAREVGPKWKLNRRIKPMKKDIQ